MFLIPHFFLGLKKHIVPIPSTPKNRQRVWETLQPDSRTKISRKEQALPIVKKMLQMHEETQLFLFSAEDLDNLKNKYQQNDLDVIDADDRTSCLHFIRMNWTNKNYKDYRNNADDYKIRLVPFDQMKKALDVLMCIPKPIRCQDVETCKKCGILSIADVMKFELSLEHVRSKILFFSKNKVASLVDHLRLDSGRSFEHFDSNAPTLFER